MTRAFIFPGQGSQAVGMGKALAEAFAVARETFQEVDEALAQNLSRLMWEGPESDLVLTENAQPAIMAASLAVIAVLRREGGLDLAKHARLVAGHSLGEYSALAASGAFTLADTARLLKARGRAMQQAVPVGEGGMSALLGAEIETPAALAKKSGEQGRDGAERIGAVPFADDAARRRRDGEGAGGGDDPSACGPRCRKCDCGRGARTRYDPPPPGRADHCAR